MAFASGCRRYDSGMDKDYYGGMRQISRGATARMSRRQSRKLEPCFNRGVRVRPAIVKEKKTRYDWFLSRLVEENRIEREGPRVIRGTGCSWESTRQGKLKFYIDRWTEVAAPALDLMVQEISAGERSGEHRHIFEELLLVVKGRGFDLRAARDISGRQVTSSVSRQ